MSVLHRLVAPGVCVVAAMVGAACSQDGGSTEAFCADLQEHADAVVNPALTTQADVEAYLALHDELGRDVPLTIEEDWTVYAGALRGAAAVVPGDTDGAEAARQAVYAAEESAFRVYDWADANCGLDLSTIGPVARYDPAATTTTVAD